MNFKSSKSLFSRVKEDLYSFDAAGLLDEGKFYKDVQYVLFSLGAMWYAEKEETLEVERYRAVIPKDFTIMESVYRLHGSGQNPIHLPDGIVFSEFTFDHYPETQIPDWNSPLVCPAQTDYWMQDGSKIFNSFKYLLIQRGNEVRSYHPPILMRPGNVDTKKFCSKACHNGPHHNSPDVFTIQNGYLYTNFEHGDILLTYKGFALDEDGLPMIPDNVLIEKAIEDYIKYNIIKNLRTNGDADVSQLINIYKADQKESMGKAITETKLPSFATTINQIRKVKQRLNMYQLDNRYPHNPVG